MRLLPPNAPIKARSSPLTILKAVMSRLTVTGISPRQHIEPRLNRDLKVFDGRGGYSGETGADAYLAEFHRTDRRWVKRLRRVDRGAAGGEKQGENRDQKAGGVHGISPLWQTSLPSGFPGQAKGPRPAMR